MTDFAREQTIPRLNDWAAALREAGGDPGKPEKIHALRVSSRRLAQCLRLFEEGFDSDAVREIHGRVKKLLRRCGAVRDCDIALKLLAKTGFSQRSRVAVEIRHRREKASAKLEKRLGRLRGADFEQEWAERLATNGKAAPVAGLTALTHELFERGNVAAAPGSSFEEMHNFRLLAKRYRYTVEILRPVYGEPETEPVLAGLRGLQDRMGEMNDAFTALELVRGHKRAELAMQRLLGKREREFRSHWKREFDQRRCGQWTSIFSATAKPSPGPRALRKQPGSLRRAAAKTSAA